MQTLLQDLKYGFRLLLKSPGFTAVAVLSLALGIGANTALFSLVDTVLLGRLSVRQPEELVLFNWTSGQNFIFVSHSGTLNRDPATGLRVGSSISYPAFEQFRARTRTLSDVFAFAPLGQLNVNVDGQAEIAGGQLITGGFYAGLGVQPVLGRAITDDDDRAGADPVAVVSHRYWQRRFGLDPGVVGKVISLNGVPFTIVGVTPPQFYGGLQVGSSPDLSIPMTMEPRLNQGGSSEMNEAWYWWVQVMGRMKPGVNAEAVRAELEGVFQQNAQAGWDAVPSGRRPPDYGPRELPRLLVFSGDQGLAYLREGYEKPLRMMMVVVGLVLLVACANVANLLLARAGARRQEIAVRLALGSGRFRLVRQLLTESVLLAALGGALGLLLAWWAKDLLLMWQPSGRGQLDADLQLNWRVFGFTAAVALLTGILFGLVPALRATRVDLNSVLRENTRGAGGSLSVFGKSLVIAQVALSLVLLIGAGLFIRTLHNLQSVELGFNPENVLLFRVDPGLKGYRGEQILSLYRQMIERIETVPGVRSATMSQSALLSGRLTNGSMYVQGGGTPRRADNITWQHRVRWNFFETMEIPLLAGRSLTAQDDERAPKVAVINQTLARQFFGDDNPIGKRFGFGRPENSGQIEVVGVVRDAKYTRQRQDFPPTVYLPYPQVSPGQMTFELRTAGDPRLMIGAVREAVRQVDRELPISEVRTQSELAEQSLSQERIFARLTGFFGLLALLLASIGLYGVMSYTVAQRTHEIAIRMTLGATPAGILRRSAGEGMLLAVIGIISGAAAAAGLTRFLSSFLFGISATDPGTFVFIAVLLMVVAFVACWVPARRATKVDPMVALRYE